MRYFAAISLGRLGTSAPLQQLATRRANDPAPHVRVAAVEAIGAIGGDDAVGILKPLAAEDTGDSALAALRVLGNAQSDAVVPTLRDAVRSPDAARRLAAVEALAKLRCRGCGRAAAVDRVGRLPTRPSCARRSTPSRTHRESERGGSRSAVRARR